MAGIWRGDRNPVESRSLIISDKSMTHEECRIGMASQPHFQSWRSNSHDFCSSEHLKEAAWISASNCERDDSNSYFSALRTCLCFLSIQARRTSSSADIPLFPSKLSARERKLHIYAALAPQQPPELNTFRLGFFSKAFKRASRSCIASSHSWKLR